MNASGGVLGRQMLIDQGDDKADPQAAVLAAQKLTSDGVAAVIGPLTSGAAISASTIFDQASIPMISPSANDPKLTDRGQRFVFRAAGRWDQEPALLADYLIHTSGKSKFALVSDGSSYGQLLTAAMTQALATRGSTPVDEEILPASAQDFGPLITKVRSSGADALFFGGFYGQAGAIAKQLSVSGANIQLAAGDGIQDQAFVNAAGNAANGVLFVFPPDPRQTPSAAKFLAAYKQKYGTEASLYAISTYDCVKLLADAIQRAGSTDGAAIRDAIAATNGFDGIYWGKMSFDQKGDLVGRTWALWTVRDGKFQQMQAAASG